MKSEIMVGTYVANEYRDEISIRESTQPSSSRYKIISIQQIDDDIYLIQGTISSKKILTKDRNMVVLRRHIMGNQYELTLINPIRLDEEGMEQLEQLGIVYMLIRLGPTVGATDDEFYIQKYPYCLRFAPGYLRSLSSSASKKMKKREAAFLPIHRILSEDSFLLDHRTDVFIFRDTIQPEAALLLRRKRGNILITSESLQSHQDGSAHFNLSMKMKSKREGMHDSSIVVSPRWLKKMSTKKDSLREDFERLLRLDFTRHIGLSGNVVGGQVRESCVLAVEMAFQWN